MNPQKIECEGYTFNLGIVYERLPKFCSHCKVIGHNIAVCKWLHPHTESIREDKGRNLMLQTSD
jgi:hypothetical protein